MRLTDRTLSLLLLVFLCGHATAQNRGRKGMGVKFGAQWCNLSASDRTYEAVPGAAAGIYFPLLASARLELQPELLLSYQGSNMRIGETRSASLRMLYAQVPLNAKVYLGNSFNLQVGLMVARCLMARRDGEVVTDTFRNFDSGFTAGIGVDTYRGMDFTLRYCSGTAPLLLETSGVNPRSRILQVTMGFRVLRFRSSRVHFGRR